MRKRTEEEIKETVKKLGYKLLDEYMYKNLKRVVIQDFNGYKYNVQLSNLMCSKSPDFVAKSNPFTLQNISLWLKKENKPFILCDDNIYGGNTKKLYFLCLKESCREIFDMAWFHIYGQGFGCPFCSGNRVGKRNNLEYLRPELAKEWDYSKNKGSPKDYTEFSHKRVSWICSKCEHNWDTRIAQRSNGTGCPKCSNLQWESKVANELKEYFKETYGAEDEYKIIKNPRTGRWLRFDIYIPHGKNPKLNGFYIEVHGHQHYRLCYWYKKHAEKNDTTPEEEFEYQKKLDRLKRKFAKDNGIYIEIDLRKVTNSNDAINKIKAYLEEKW